MAYGQRVGLGAVAWALSVGLFVACGGGDSDPVIAEEDAGGDGAVATDAQSTGDTTLADGGEDVTVDATIGDGEVTSDASDAADATDATDAGDAAAVDGSVDASDAGDAADAADGGGGCSGTNTACTTAGGKAGLCKASVCSSCSEPADDGACASAYGAGTICGGGVCVTGDCHDGSTCSLLKPACVQFACTSCDAQTGNVFVVDPNGGSDGSSGSGTAAGVASPACAFKTVERALGVIRSAALADGGAPPVGTTVRVIGPATITNANDVVPIELVDNVALEGVGNVVVSFGAGETIGIKSAPGARLKNLTVDGNHGGNTFAIMHASGTLLVENVTARNANVGLEVFGGAVTMRGGALSGNESGAYANDGVLTLDGSKGAILVKDNTNTGVTVTADAALVVSADAAQETVKITGSPIGLAFLNGAATTLSDVDGLVVRSCSDVGVLIGGGTFLRMRRSVSLANAVGVFFGKYPGASSTDMSRVDLGADVGANAGANVFQDKASGTPNSGAGLCFALEPNQAQTILAKGNRFATADGTGTVDCKIAAAGTHVGASTTTCAGGVNLGGTSKLVGNTLALDQCVP